ncbi:MAG: DNA methyltransferase, partial [Verrucomicrobiales bacterium]|nr:DNA methyltransferase [Verrucomicrobiales bacterium]
GTGTTMIAAMCTGRNSIGVEIDPEYCRIAARYLKAEASDLFARAELVFERTAHEQPSVLHEDHALYEVQPARQRLS